MEVSYETTLPIPKSSPREQLEKQYKVPFMSPTWYYEPRRLIGIDNQYLQ